MCAVGFIAGINVNVSLISVSVPRVCDACKETEENDNEIVDNLCKNDFGKSTLLILLD